jgi:hypothetical protein
MGVLIVRLLEERSSLEKGFGELMKAKMERKGRRDSCYHCWIGEHWLAVVDE